MTKRPKDSAVGPWAKEKLDALRQYLDYYTTVLKKPRALAPRHNIRRCVCRAWAFAHKDQWQERRFRRFV